jgi:hypothetical protein
MLAVTTEGFEEVRYFADEFTEAGISPWSRLADPVDAQRAA